MNRHTTDPDDKPPRQRKARPRGTSDYICAKCGLPVQLWNYGWKHSAGHGSPKSCGAKPEPVLRPKGNL